MYILFSHIYRNTTAFLRVCAPLIGYWGFVCLMKVGKKTSPAKFLPGAVGSSNSFLSLYWSTRINGYYWLAFVNCTFKCLRGQFFSLSDHPTDSLRTAQIGIILLCLKIW